MKITRRDKILDKLLSIESLAYNARCSNEDRIKAYSKRIKINIRELLTILNTDEAKGKSLGWWG